MSNLPVVINQAVQGLVQRIAPEYIVISGKVNKIKRLNVSESFVTRHNTKTDTSFRYNPSNSTNLYNSTSITSGSSNTETETEYSISLLQVDGVVMSDVEIESSSIYDFINKGDDVSLIMSSGRDKLYYVKNNDDNSTIGRTKKPIAAADVLKWLAVLGGFFDIGLALVCFPSAYLLFRASAEGKKNWTRALASI